MPVTQDIGRLLLIAGIILSLIGMLIHYADRIPWIGKLPGDIYIRRENFTFYFPLTTSILISIVVTFFLWLYTRR